MQILAGETVPVVFWEKGCNYSLTIVAVSSKDIFNLYYQGGGSGNK